jgi:hypothetical protein
MFVMKVIKTMFVVFLLTSSIAFAGEYTYEKDISPCATLESCISSKASEYNVSEKLITRIVMCESGGNPNANLHTSREDSWGVAQINLKAHPQITKEQAIDIEFAIDFLAKNLSNGRGSMWTCYKEK